MKTAPTKSQKSSESLSFSTRVDRELYETFHQVAREQGTNASVLIRQFMQGYAHGKLTQSFNEEQFDALFRTEKVKKSLSRLSSALDMAIWK